MKFKHSWQTWQIILFGLFLSWFLGINLWLAWQDSQTIDEAAHITSGYSYLTTRNFRLNPEHPPLFKELAATPLFSLNVRNIKTLNGWSSGNEWKAGKDFVYHSPASPRQIIFTARIAPIIISLALGLLIFALTASLSNISFGLLALGLYTLDPNIIAHSHLVTNDISAALGCLLALASLFYYVNKPSLRRLLLVGAGLGIALGLKFSTLLALAYVLLLLLISIFLYEKPNLKWWPKIWVFIKKILFVGVIAGLLIFIFYGFEVVKPASSQAYAGNIAHQDPIFNSVQNMYIPLYSFMRGIGRVFAHSDSYGSVNSTYLLGQYSVTGWRYFLFVYLIKTPLVILLGSAITLIFGIKSLIKLLVRKNKPSKKQFYILGLGGFIVIYILACMMTHIYLGWRHLLPIYPPLFILIALTIQHIFNRYKNHLRICLAVVIVAFGFLILSWARQFPYYLSYSNELIPIVNRSSHWPRLVDSNLDWGQDIYRLIIYAKANPSKQLYYSVFTNADLNQLSLPSNMIWVDSNNFNQTSCKPPGNGYLLLSYQNVYNYPQSEFACKRGQAPDALIGSSILVFNN